MLQAKFKIQTRLVFEICDLRFVCILVSCILCLFHLYVHNQSSLRKSHRNSFCLY